MQQGRGFTTCLLCEQNSNLVLGHKIVARIVRACYDTDKYDIMLQNSKLCIKCIGRLQQLNDYCAGNELEGEFLNEEVGKLCCNLCRSLFSSDELITQAELILKETQTIPRIKLIQNDQKLACCFSCYNFVHSFNELRDLLNRLNELYSSALRSCSVVLKDCKDTTLLENIFNEVDIIDKNATTFNSNDTASFKKSGNITSPPKGLKFTPFVKITKKRTRSRPNLSNWEPKRKQAVASEIIQDLFAKHNLKNCSVLLERLILDHFEGKETDDVKNEEPNKKRCKVEKKKVSRSVKIKIGPKFRRKRSKTNTKKRGSDVVESDETNQDVTSILLENFNSSGATEDETFEPVQECVTNCTQTNVENESNHNVEIACVTDQKVSDSKKEKDNKKEEQGSTEYDTDVIEEYLQSDNENTQDSSIDELYYERTEVEFLSPIHRHKGVHFEKASSFENFFIKNVVQNQQQQTAIGSDLINLDVNFAIEESDPFENLLRSSSSRQNTVSCPIFTMDELQKEESLMN